MIIFAWQVLWFYISGWYYAMLHVSEWWSVDPDPLQQSLSRSGDTWGCCAHLTLNTQGHLVVSYENCTVANQLSRISGCCFGNFREPSNLDKSLNVLTLWNITFTHIQCFYMLCSCSFCYFLRVYNEALSCWLLFNGVFEFALTVFRLPLAPHNTLIHSDFSAWANEGWQLRSHDPNISASTPSNQFANTTTPWERKSLTAKKTFVHMNIIEHDKYVHMNIIMCLLLSAIRNYCIISVWDCFIARRLYSNKFSQWRFIFLLQYLDSVSKVLFTVL